MKKLKKSLSVLLTLVMLFTTFCFFPLDLGAIEADAAISGVKIVVPETIYLTPSTSASTAGQYYVNNNSDGSVVANYDSVAKVYISYTGATGLKSVTASTSAGAVNLDWLSFTPSDLKGESITGECNVELTSGVNAGNAELIEWVFVFDVNGETKTHYAYSVAYSPFYSPVGASAEVSSGRDGSREAWAGSVLWVSGVHGYTATTYSGGSAYYPVASRFVPMLDIVSITANKDPANVDVGLLSSSSSTPYPTISYYRYDGGGGTSTNYHSTGRSTSPVANITVDTSRYGNFNQIPNFKVGYLIADLENDDSAEWFVADYTGYSDDLGFGSTTNNSETNADNLYNRTTGTKLITGTENNCSVKYNGLWDKAVSSGTIQLKAGLRGRETGAVIKTSASSHLFVQMEVTTVSKSDIRTNVQNGTSYGKENYTTASWNTYQAELRKAALNLGNPVSATVDTSALANAENALQTTVYFDGNGGNASVASTAVTIGGNSTATFTPTATAAREGYTFKGWSTDKNATTASASLTVGFNQTVYAVWEANQYSVAFDNLIALNEWNTLTANNGVISNVTETGFTLTSDDGAGEATSSSPYFAVEPGKSYKIDIDFVGDNWDVYIFFCDVDGNWVDFADGPTNRYSANGSTGIDKDNAVFTAPDKAEVVKAQIRVDANGANNTVSFNNIRVYEVGTVADGVSYEPSTKVTYDSAYGSALPTPTKENYRFDGWYTEPNGKGTKIASDTIVKITSTTILYSNWVDANYYISFDGNTGSGSMETVKANIGEDYTLPSNTFTKTGYNFLGWALDSSAAAATYGNGAAVQLATKVSTVTLYAVWAKNDYTINYVGGDGAAGSVEPQSAKYDENITLRANSFNKTGYIFSGWTDGVDTYPAGADVKNLTTVQNGTVTFTAVWTPITYTINFAIPGATIDPITVTYDEAASRLPDGSVFNKTGYTFGGWVVAGTDTAVTNDNYDVLVTVDGGSVTLTAIENENSYTVVFDGNSATDGETDSQTVKYTDTFTLNANGFTKIGYTFKGWSLTENGDVKYADKAADIAKLTAEVDGIVTLYAVWEANTYTVTFDKNDEAATGEMNVQSFTYDEAQVLTALGYVKEGWHFVEWNTLADGQGTGYADMSEAINLTADVNGEVTLYAIWTINLYDVVFKFNGKDGTEMSVTRTDVAHGTDFSTLIPTQDEGFVTTYYNADADKDAPHYNFNDWANKVDEITGDLEFDATYTEEAHVYYDKIGTSYGATCLEKGLKAEYCGCGYEYAEEIPALGHNWVETGRTATCTEAGFINSKCVRTGCSATKQDVLAALGHTDGEWKVTTAAGCITKGEESNFCGTCNEIWHTREVPATGHSFTEMIGTTAPTCVLPGNVEYKQCEYCDLYFESGAAVDSADGKATNEDFIIPANGHKTVLAEAADPKCEEDGNIAYYTCENCDLLFKDEEAAVIITLADTVVSKTGHDYAGVVTAPTCVDKGFTTYTCKNDESHTYVADEVPANGHDDSGEWVETIAPDCTNTGTEKLYCETCGVEIASREVDANGHDYETVVTPPTCVDKGFTTYTCHCGDSYVADYVDALGHKEAKRQEVIHAATCTVAGDYWDITYCSVCDTEISRVQITGQTLPHTYTQEIIDADHLKEAATCVKYAVYYYDCVNCDANAKDVDGATFEYAAGGFDAENHIGTTTTGDEDIVDGTCSTEKTWNEVTRCDDCNAVITSVPKTGDKDKNNHIGETKVEKEEVVPGTCTTVETWNDVTYCLDCGNAINTEAKTGEKNPANHSTTETVLKDDKAATCCEKGYTGNMHCADCDAIVTYGEEIAENKENHAGGTKTEKEDVVPGTCVSAEKWNDVTYCAGCGEKLGTVAQTGEIDKANHAGEKRTEKENEAAGTCETEASWTEVTYCEDCGEEISREDKTGEKDAANHTGETYTENINMVAGNCDTAATWTEVTYCKGCDTELSREDKVGATDPTVHTGETYTKDEDIAEGTCKSEKTWNEVTYCSGCDEKLSSVEKTGEKGENNHVGAADKIVGYIAPTCKSEGYTGDTYWNCCDTLYKTGTAIPTTEHIADEAVKENEIPATDTEDGSYESVVYCSVCGEEISRETVAVRLERTITFVMLDKTVEIKAYNGDTVTIPEVADYTGSDGFIYKFKSWDKAVAVVNGDAAYNAIYTEPCDYTELDHLEETLKEVLEGGLADDSVLEENKAKIEEVLAQIEEINKDRNTRDKSEQNEVDFVVGEISGLIDIIYPDAGSTLVIEGSSVAYAGTVLDLKAVKMPLGTVLTDAQWVSSDDNIVFFSNGKLYAIGTGTVTLTATRGILKASKVVTIIEGGNTRGINFTSINNTHFIIEDYAAVYNSAIIYWSDDFDLRFRVRVYQSFMFEDYIVYINGQEVEPNAEGYYVVPAGSGDARVTIAGAMIDTGAGEGEVVTKWSFWEWLLNFFRKIAAFFQNLFN